MYEDTWELLAALDGVPQDPRYHPEGDALFHSLQVYALARQESADPTLWAAALLHDVGKSVAGPTHDREGAALLAGLYSTRIVWLVEHHLDLLRAPAVTRRRTRDKALLADLERLRRWDLRGRDPRASTPGVQEALASLVPYFPALCADAS